MTEQDTAPDETLEESLISYAWTIIANAGEGDWTRETQTWQDAAARWRGQYHAWLDTRKDPR